MEYKVGQPPWAYQTGSAPVSAPLPIPGLSTPVLSTPVLSTPVLSTPVLSEEPSEIMHGVINGLAATISLWIFWVPFIIFIGRPLINAQIKEQVCFTEIGYFPYKREELGNGYNQQLDLFLYTLVAEGKITETEQQELYKKYMWINEGRTVPPDVQHTLDINPQKNWDDNFGLITIFSIALAAVLVGCVFLILAACAVSGIDAYHVLKFNLLMTLIIVVIECSFFGGVTMRYMPYNLNAILAQSEQKILGFFN
jgi:hypothetical protein